MPVTEFEEAHMVCLAVFPLPLGCLECVSECTLAAVRAVLSVYARVNANRIAYNSGQCCIPTYLPSQKVKQVTLQAREKMTVLGYLLYNPYDLY